MKRNLYVGLAFLGTLGGLWIGSEVLAKRAEGASVMAPRFEVDPLWPKPLPNHWMLGQTIGVSVDAQDHVWIIHRAGSLEPGEVHATTNPPTAQCCAPAPPVLEFDPAGNLRRPLGRPGPGLRLARFESRHHGRLQRQRLDRRQRPRRTASTATAKRRARWAACSRSTTTWC